jgi:hypothetical protein
MNKDNRLKQTERLSHRLQANNALQFKRNVILISNDNCL